MMKRGLLAEIMAEGEGYLVEFKESLSHLEKDFSAFANASGGTIYIGVTDQGKIKPIPLTNRLKSQIQSMARNCDPPLEVELGIIDKTIAIDIRESTHKPVRAPDGFYLRIGSNSQKLTREEILRFAVSEVRILFDRQLYIKEEASHLLSTRQIESFREKARLETELDNKQLLENIGCMQRQNRKEYLTYAGILLFAENPQKIFPQATLSLFHMKDQATILEQKIFRGTLFQQVESGFEFLKTTLHTRPEIRGLRRKDILEIPEFVLRELLVNAVVHRDYFEMAADVVVKVFTDKIEFCNPGIVSTFLSLDSIWGRSFRRNPVLADIFFRANYIERAGTGLLRVRKTLKELHFPQFTLKEEGPLFLAILPRKQSPFLEEELNQRQIEMIEWPKEFFPFSTKDYAKRFSISERMARLDIHNLVHRKILISIRKGRTIEYERKHFESSPSP